MRLSLASSARGQGCHKTARATHTVWRIKHFHERSLTSDDLLAFSPGHRPQYEDGSSGPAEHTLTETEAEHTLTETDR